MRDLMVLASLIYLVPASLANAFVAYLIWSWTSTISINYYLYGMLHDFRFNFYFGVITLYALFFGNKDRVKFKINTTQVLFVIFLIHVMLCAHYAYQPNPTNTLKSEQVMKSIIFCLVMPLVIYGKFRIFVLVVVLSLGLGFHGVVEGLKVIASGGSHKIEGIYTSSMADNNLLASGMAMILPVMYFLHEQFRHKNAKLVALGTLLLLAVTIIGSDSRGAFVALVITGGAILITSRNRKNLIPVMFLAVLAMGFVAGEAWKARINTIGTAEQDDSFMGRVSAWKISSAIAINNPIFGGGLYSAEVQNVWDQHKNLASFIPDTVDIPEHLLEKAHATHSIYFQSMGDLGFVGFFLFIGILVNAFLSAQKARSLVKRLRGDELKEHLWLLDLSTAILALLVAYTVAGMTLNLTYLEPYYEFVMLAEVLKQEALKIHNKRASLSGNENSPSPERGSPSPTTARMAG